MIAVAGASGNLGSKIVAELLRMKLGVRALVRRDTPLDRLNVLRELGADLVTVDYVDAASLQAACRDVEVVVCALAGLADVICGAQLRLFKAAATSGVSRFIPSDFSIDFTKVPEGSNRNLDVRRHFMQLIANETRLQVTSILNGAFTDMLTGEAPFILYNAKMVLCWGDRNQQMDFTTVANTATYTAFAATDPTTPRFLQIAGDQISATEMARIMTELTGERFKVFRPGGLKTFSAVIAATKFFSSKSDELYPAWQGMQYMHNMFSGFGKAEQLDNNRYDVKWTTAREFVAAKSSVS